MDKTIQQLKGTACIITGGLLDTHHAKTAHGLLRESNRFELLGIVDDKLAGGDIREVIGSQINQVPIFATITDLIKNIHEKPTYAVIGMATKGGKLPEKLYPIIEEAILLGIHIVNGLHQPLASIPQLNQLAEKSNAKIFDIRKPKSFEELQFWSGKILEVNCLKIGILGTDCAVGKRTTAKLLTSALNKEDIRTEMIFTGQTGWMQGTPYGFIFDATPNDFIPGEIENAIYECWENEKPHVIIVEGQASLQNPGGPCGSEFIISGRLDGIILQHHPIRTNFNNLENYPAHIPDVIDEIDLIKRLGADTWALTLNSAGLSPTQRIEHKNDLLTRSGIPTIFPLEEGTDEIIKIIKEKLVAIT